MHSTWMLMYGSGWTQRSDCWFRVTRVRKKDGSLSVGDRPLPSCRAHPRLICMSRCIRTEGLFNKPADGATHENSSALVIINLIRIINISHGDTGGALMLAVLFMHCDNACPLSLASDPTGSDRLDSANDCSHNVVRVRGKEDHGS